LEAGRLSWAGVTSEEVQAYARTRAHLGHSARGATFCSLRVFYAWAVLRRYLATSPAAELKTPNRPRPQPKALKQAHVRQLVVYLASQVGLRARRDEALLLTALYTGLRAAELARLRWSAVDLDAEMITIYLSKMGHGRIVPIHPKLLLILKSWQQIQSLGSDAPVFSSAHDGESITPARVGKIAKRVREATGLPLTAHVLRHTFATWTLKKSKDLYSVSKALGHAALKQTEIYVSADVDQIAAAVETLPGPDEW
jgi:integrase/recombinase XerD